MSTKFDSILDTIGRTPVVRIGSLAPRGINLFAKLEAFNPMGSVKDRLAIGVIEAAERSGALKPGQTVIEATSGNTGIGLAMVCARKGYPLVVVMAENFSVERRKLMRFLGARVVLTPAAAKGSGMLAKARELANRHSWFLARQFENEANAEVHSRTTAQEILATFKGERLDYWVTGFGTGGTLKGVARVLRAERPETGIIVCEPDNSALLASGTAQPDGASHPLFRPHLMQGWAPDFIAKLTQDALAAGHIDKIVPVSGADALRLSRELATKEGILAGISGGATLAGALAIAETALEGSNILCMLPDTGERYLSTPLFEHVRAEMNEEEIAISRSTSGFGFDAPPPAPARAPVPAPVQAPAAVDAQAAGFVEDVIGEAAQPVVMFALEWCEFCWSVRKLFTKLGVPYRSVDLDAAAFAADGWGGKVRSALTARTGMVTIPQIFIGGELLGGCSELFAANQSGELRRLLERSGMALDATTAVDAEQLLPSWLHPRQPAA
ncbi:MAG TPA: pyridoxal-phosphate dependent enzyme [Burkholderiales bacterium]|nr:pyridoxal-phosphate dependent enzyme [Burkholderiales bacterium]